MSVILPVLDEEPYLADAVATALGQDYPGALDVVIALGPSKDGTDRVAAELVAADSRVRTVPNPSGRTPDGLNAALSAATGDVVVRVDGHAELADDYVRVAVGELIRVGADNVGGIMDAQGITAFQKAVGCAMRSRIGVGNARFHVGGEAGPADTVYLGVFRRATLARLGGFDRRFARAQDWELNHRIREDGGLVWFSPRLRVVYRPRRTVATLARQYLHYGRWRRVVARRHVGTINRRYLAPPAMVLAVTAGALLTPWFPPAALLPLGYLGSVVVGGVVVARGEPWTVRALVPVALTVMHWAWGVGFLTSPRRLGT